MGCYNVSCSVSGLSISYGDPIVYIMLGESHDRAYTKPLENNNCFLYPHDVFAPVALPIFGEYNGYGGIEKLDDDENIHILSEEYGISVENVVNDRKYIPPYSSSMFVHREIFDLLVAHKAHFEVDHEEEYRKFLADVKSIKYVGHNKRLANYDLDSYGVIVRMKASIFSFKGFRDFHELYIPLINAGMDLKDPMIQFIKFCQAMHSFNTMFLPALGGSQDSCYSEMKSLNEVSLGIVNTRLAECE